MDNFRRAIGLTLTLCLSACAAPIVPGYLTTTHPANPAAPAATKPMLSQALHSYRAFVNTPSLSPRPNTLPPEEKSRPQGQRHAHHHAMVERK